MKLYRHILEQTQDRVSVINRFMTLLEKTRHAIIYRNIIPLCFVTETCNDVQCPGGLSCVVDQNNNAYCVTCERVCPEVTSPEQYLCGNDGTVYASACHLRRATCILGRSIGIAYEGKCIGKRGGKND